MIFTKDTLYRLTELPNAFIIGPRDAVVPSKDAEPLCICDTAAMMEYLSRYLWERTHGTERTEAHERALKHADIMKVRAPERVL